MDAYQSAIVGVTKVHSFYVDPVWCFTAGIYLGYPACCIQAFIDGPGAMHRTDDFPLLGTGFVPCLSCSKHHTAEELTAIIGARRISKTPFPDDGEFYDTEEFKAWLNDTSE